MGRPRAGDVEAGRKVKTKGIFQGLAAMAIVLLLAGCAAANRSVDTELRKSDLEVRIYEVFGMDCPGCHGGLEKLVLRIPGVRSAEANWEAKRLTVAVEPGAGPNDEEIFEAIRQANFTPGTRLQ